MTSVSGAGYQSKRQGTFDPLNQGHGPAPALAEKSDNGPEYLAKEMERQVYPDLNSQGVLPVHPREDGVIWWLPANDFNDAW